VVAHPRLPDVAELRGRVHHVALGEDAGDLPRLLHHHRPDAVLLHDLGGLLERLVGVDRDHRTPHEVADLHGKGLLDRAGQVGCRPTGAPYLTGLRIRLEGYGTVALA
jgi:hypothetical protein